MKKATKVLLEEIIEYYESCGKDRSKTIAHFFRAKKGSKQRISKLITRYLKGGPEILQTTQTRTTKKPRAKPRYFWPEALETSKKILKLLQEDPSVTNSEGAQILGISRAGFAKHKRRLVTPGRLTTEMKIQLGLIPAPEEPEVGKRGNVPVSEELEESEPDFGGVEMDYGSDNDGFEGEQSPTTTTTPATFSVKAPPKPKKTFRHCLLCYICLDADPDSCSGSGTRKNPTRGRRPSKQNEEPTVPRMPSDDNVQLGDNINVVFALKNIFSFSSTDLIKIMEVSKGKDPRGWYHLCGECDRILKEAVSVQYQVLQLTRELEKCKSRIEDKLKGSSESETESENIEDGDDLQVTNLIRDSICQPWRKNKTTASSFKKISVKGEQVNNDDHEDDSGGFFDDAFDADDDPTDFETPVPTSDNPTVGPTPDSTATSQSSAAIANPELNLTSKNPKQVICDICGEFFRLFTLPVHTLRVHGVLIDGYTEFKCLKEGCNYTTVYKDNLYVHAKNVHVSLETSKWACQFCGKKFKCHDYLIKHENTHKNAETRPYKCETCGRGFKVNATLWMHVKQVHQGYVSPYRKRLLARMEQEGKTPRIRRAPPPRGKKFPPNPPPKKKEPVEGQNSFPCNICNVNYSHERTYLSHMKKVHPEPTSENEDSTAGEDEGVSEMLKCRHCPFQTPFRPALNKHVESHKADEGFGFSCEKCGKSYTYLQGLRRHERISHSEKNVETPCPHCHRVFASAEYMRDHVKKFCKMKGFNNQQPLQVAGGENNFVEESTEMKVTGATGSQFVY